MDEFREKLDKILIFTIVYSLFFILFFKTLKLTLPFVLAIVFSLILYKPAMYFIKKFKINNSIVSIIITLLFYALILSLTTIFLIIITQELISLGKNIQDYIILNMDYIYSIFNKMQRYYLNLDPTLINSIRDNLINSISNLAKGTVSATRNMVNFLLSMVSFIPYFFIMLIFSILSTYYFTKYLTSEDKNNKKFKNNIKVNRAIGIFNETKKMLYKYFASYTLIIGVTFIETLLGFSIIQVKYTVILSFLCAIFDILPVFGVGSVYIPLIIIYFASGDIFRAVFIICMYLIITIVRNIIEPKIISSTLGIPSIQVLIAIFVGLEANGIYGIIFCIFFVIFYNILKQQNVI